MEVEIGCGNRGARENSRCRAPRQRDEPEERAKVQACAPFELFEVAVPALDIASSDLRARAARGESIRYLVSEAAYEAIREFGLYRAVDSAAGADRAFDDGEAGLAACDADPFSDEFVAARTEQLAKRVKPKRFRHIQGVADAAGSIAAAYGVDARAARLGGLLHDWDKGLGDDAIRKRARELDVFVPGEVFDKMPQLMHGPTAAAALGRSYPQDPRMRSSVDFASYHGRLRHERFGYGSLRCRRH